MAVVLEDVLTLENYAASAAKIREELDGIPKVDTELNESSGNAVANSAVAEAVNNPSTARVINALNSDFIISWECNVLDIYKADSDSDTFAYFILTPDIQISYDDFTSLFNLGYWKIEHSENRTNSIWITDEKQETDGLYATTAVSKDTFDYTEVDNIGEYLGNSQIRQHYIYCYINSEGYIDFVIGSGYIDCGFIQGETYYSDFGVEGWKTYLLNRFNVYSKDDYEEITADEIDEMWNN